MKQKIVNKLSFVGCGIAICMAIVLTTAILINKKGTADAIIINVAGKQRMLSQKISKEVFIINSQDKFDFVELNSAIKEFGEGFNLLKYGSAKLFVKPSKNINIDHQLEVIKDIWDPFLEQTLIFVGAMRALNKDKIFLDAKNNEMLILSDNVVKSMVEHGLSGEDVDDSGRQRMLTQRMGYHLMRYTTKWDKQSMEDFYNSFNLYSKTILNFYTKERYKKYPKLRDEIEKTYEFWKTYSAHIYAVLASQKTIVDSLNLISSKNTLLLAEIDSAVTMYTNDSIKERSYLTNFLYASSFVLFLLALYSISVISNIKDIFDEFIQRSKNLANLGDNFNVFDKDKLSQIMQISGNHELSEVSENITTFIEKINGASKNSNPAKELSDSITNEISLIVEEVTNSLKILDISDQERAKIISEINLSEDIVIQTSEELISTSKLLEKLKQSLNSITKYYSGSGKGIDR